MTAQYLFRTDPLTTISLAADSIFGAYVAATVHAGADVEMISRKKWLNATSENAVPESVRLKAAQKRWRQRNPGYSTLAYKRRKEARKAAAEVTAS